MSGIFGTFHRNKEPADCHLWEKLGKVTAHRGVDGTDSQSDGSVLLGHNALHTTVESLQEKLPYFCTTTGLAITADARIDNRSELFSALDIEGKRHDTISDNRLVLLAYEKWGEDSFRRLLGDFSFVLWDRKEQKMHCVRDSLGVKPFYYSLSDKQFSFSSEIKTLVQHPEISKELNEGMIGEYLAASLVSKTETLYRDIRRLAAGHALTVTPADVTIRRYWEPDFEHKERYRDERDSVEQFKEIFSEAIGCRLRSHLPVSFELSGGLDSSSIVGMAYSMASGANRETSSVYSLTYPGLACDERQYIEHVQKHLGIPVGYIAHAYSDISPLSQKTPQTFTIPDPPNLTNSEALLHRVQQNKSRVIITGIGGDEWFSGSEDIYLEQFREKEYQLLVHNFKREFGGDPKKACKRAAANLIWPYLPHSIKKSILRRVKSSSLYPPWISPDFARKIDLEERLLKAFGEAHVADLAHAGLYSLFYSGYEANVLETNDLQKARYQVEGRHPFLDRRLVEFALALPDSLHRHNGMSKYLLRQAGKSYLPAAVRNRNSKAEFSQLYYQLFNSKLFANTLKESKLYDRGWIDKASLGDGYNSSMHCFQRNPSGPCPATIRIWFAFAVLAWYEESL